MMSAPWLAFLVALPCFRYCVKARPVYFVPIGRVSWIPDKRAFGDLQLTKLCTVDLYTEMNVRFAQISRWNVESYLMSHRVLRFRYFANGLRYVILPSCLPEQAEAASEPISFKRPLESWSKP